MDIKDLNKAQLILLIILLSFVTSIATSISTFTLLNEAPPVVTQTINRVVEKTIERVAPDSLKKNQQVIVIKEEDLLISAGEKNKNTLATVKVADNADKPEELKKIGDGFVISAEGHLILDGLNISEKGSYSITLGEKTYKAEVSLIDKSGVAIMKIIPEDSKQKFEYAELADSDAIRLGQSVLALKMKEISIGIISAIEELPTASIESDEQLAEASSAPSPKPYKTFKISQNLGSSFSGSPLINLDGKVVGMFLLRDGQGIIPSNMIQNLLESLKTR
jgi:S1-C subfamily serine protease